MQLGPAEHGNGTWCRSDADSQMGCAPVFPEITGIHTVVRRVDLTDLDFLYEISVNPETSFRWRFRGSLPDRADFARQFAAGVLVQLIVERRATREAIGLVTAYSANLRDGWAYVAALSAPRFVGSGAILEGLTLLIEYVFTTWPMRKLYFESLEFNYEHFRGATGLLVQEEARLRAHMFHGGRYWDLVTGAIYRDEWTKRTVLRWPPIQRPEDSELSVEDFADLVALELLSAPPGTLGASDNLIDYFDSLKMVELGVLIEALAGPTDFEMLGEISTVRDAYKWFCIAASMPTRGGDEAG